MLKHFIMMLPCLLFIFNSNPLFAQDDLFDTKGAAILLEQGIDHLRTKNLDAAVNSLEESALIAPEAETYYYLGYAYYMKGRAGDAESRKKSIESFERAYELDPNFTPSRFRADNDSADADRGKNSEDAVTPTIVPSNPKLEAQPGSKNAVASQQKL